MGWLGRLMGERRDQALPLYNAVVAHARAPHWYLDAPEGGAVPDTIDGRFDMIAGVLATVLLRLEDDPDGRSPAAWLGERFVDDMDGQLREQGVGDVVVGKRVGRMMGMLGGRLGAYREGFAGDLRPALVRNLYRGVAPAEAALAHVEGHLRADRARLATLPLSHLMTGTLA